MNKLVFDPISETSTLVDLIRWRALYSPNKPAYTFIVDGEVESDRLTYGQLDRKSRAIGSQMQALGLKGERALLLYPPSLDYVNAFYGCLFAGVVAVPIHYPNLAQFEQTLLKLQNFAKDAQSKVILTTTALKSIVEQKLSNISSVSELKQIRWLTTDNVDDCMAEEWFNPEIDGNTLAFLQYTSGSTSTPKGVMINHSNILHNQRKIQILGQHTGESTYVSWLPIYHNAGLTGCVIQCAYVGSLCVLMSPLDFLLQPYNWLNAISIYQAYTSGGPNFAFDLCAERITAEQKEKLDLSSWTRAFSGGEAVKYETLERFAAAFSSCGFRKEAFVPIYGAAEATLVICGSRKSSPPAVRAFNKRHFEHNRVSEDNLEQQESIKLVEYEKILEEQRIYIINLDTLSPCPPDQIGEIWISDSSVAEGYWNRPEETEKTFRAYISNQEKRPFLRTGDLGFLKDGKLFVTGRIKDLIVIRGRNIYPQDIEITLKQICSLMFQPGINAVFSIEVDGEEKLIIAQELDERYLDELNIDQVDRAIRESVIKKYGLQVYEVLFLKLGSIPHTSNGKIQRSVCKAKFLDGSLEIFRRKNFYSKKRNT